MAAQRSISNKSDWKPPRADLSAAFQLAPVGLAIFDRELRFVECNDVLAEIHGVPAEQHIGKRISEILPHYDQEGEARLLSVFETGRPLRDVEVVSRSTRGPHRDRAWLVSIRPLPSETGTVELVLSSVKEITSLRKEEYARRQIEGRFQTAEQLNSDAFAIFVAVRDEGGAVVDFVYEYANPAAIAMSGVGELVGRHLSEAFPGTMDEPKLFQRYVRLLDERQCDVAELEYRKDGLQGWFRNSAVAIDPERIAVHYRDITGKKELEGQLRLVSEEYRHRLKNMFSVVDAIVAQSARTSTDTASLAGDIQGRLQALSAAQDILLANAGSAPLARLAEEILSPFGGLNLRIQPGPEVAVPTAGVVTLALALNELATNAIKYGALLRAGGAVEVTWKVENGFLVLYWIESGGPGVTEPSRKGFGTRLIQDVAKRLPRGKVDVIYRESGLETRIAFALE